METTRTSNDVRVSWQRKGHAGPPLVLVHGGFSDHQTNWQFVSDRLAQDFDVYAIARRGRGETDSTTGHAIEDEANDVVAVIRSIEQPVFLAGHSAGSLVALTAALQEPAGVKRLVLYEPPAEGLLTEDRFRTLYRYADSGEWDRFCTYFFVDVLSNRTSEIDAMRGTTLWQEILHDAPATWHDLVAIRRYRLDEVRTRALHVPTLLQIGSESPQLQYATDRLLHLLPQVSLDVLHGQAHEAMTTAPEVYAASLVNFLLSRTGAAA